MVEKDAAESLEEEDVELIRQLETTPMYLSGEMLQKLRQKRREAVAVAGPGGGAAESSQGTQAGSGMEGEPRPVKERETGDTVLESGEGDKSEDGGGSAPEEPGDGPEKAERSEDDPGTPEGAGEKFSASKTVRIRDSRRQAVSTKVEVLDEAEITRDEKDVPEFLATYNDRYDKLRKMLSRRMELKSAVSIKNLERRDEGEEAAIIGFVNDKYSTSSGKYIVELEDRTGSYKALIDERDGDRLVPDEIVGVAGSMGGDILYGNTVVRPDLPIPEGTNSTEQKVKGAYISDIHLGSVDTLEDRFDRFAEWLNSSSASDVGYLVMAGDVVEGVGVYPGQDEELKVTSIYKQYEMFEEWLKKLPEDLQVVIGPGNHDIVRLAEPQPALDHDVFPEASGYDNVHLVQNPQYVRLHGIESQGLTHLMYHGYSFDDHVDQIKELREKAYDQPEHVMIDLLKRRHLAPTFGSNLMAPGGEDSLVIDRKPDVMVSGHFHSHAVGNYKGVTTICSSTFQAQTDFQKRVGHVPDPGKVTVHDFKTRKTEVKQF
jgi:DNA polymerase II small subunit